MNKTVYSQKQYFQYVDLIAKHFKGRHANNLFGLLDGCMYMGLNTKAEFEKMYNACMKGK